MTGKLSVDEFYKDHVSKSLPCVFRNEIVDSQLVREFSELTGDDFDKYLIEKFTSGHQEFLKDTFPQMQEYDSFGGKVAAGFANMMSFDSSPPISMKVMTIDNGWIIRNRRTFTKEMTKPIKQFLEDKYAANPKKKYVHYI